ncbi:MAG: enoyl-CoA hydratase [Shouchella clausii]|uniref:enoyl-CoA hydratase n=1 Tax=Shouchella clausii TaxID=79880 RepID=UPI00271149E5|nr:enoyl-CoA hydratase [Shouchella clausii]MDO7267662.1 enoyl-CoA hydratase [Shouchella clausii]MDO7287384.1 enoyl-CoA hydratase [Shouchella clausii]
MENITWKVTDGIAEIGLKRPPANALARSVIEELSEVFENVYNDDAIKVAIIYGEGRFFAAGADIKEFTEVGDSEEFAQLGKKGQDTFNKIEAAPKPVIAAIHGAALGGGLELAMACHIRLAAPETKLGLPELNLGLIPGFGGTQRLPRLVGQPKALEMMLTSAPITAEEALNVGLVNKVCDEDHLLEEARAMARTIAAKSPLTVKRVLELTKMSEGALKEGLDKEIAYFSEVYQKEDRIEGVNAFIEKRKPVFRGN